MGVVPCGGLARGLVAAIVVLERVIQLELALVIRAMHPAINLRVLAPPEIFDEVLRSASERGVGSMLKRDAQVLAHLGPVFEHAAEGVRRRLQAERKAREIPSVHKIPDLLN